MEGGEIHDRINSAESHPRVTTQCGAEYEDEDARGSIAPISIAAD